VDNFLKNKKPDLDDRDLSYFIKKFLQDYNSQYSRAVKDRYKNFYNFKKFN